MHGTIVNITKIKHFYLAQIAPIKFSSLKEVQKLFSKESKEAKENLPIHHQDVIPFIQGVFKTHHQSHSQDLENKVLALFSHN